VSGHGAAERRISKTRRRRTDEENEDQFARREVQTLGDTT
jgi:hypothetical protein